jgi:hypothetical protein
LLNAVSPLVDSAAQLIDANVICGSPLWSLASPLYAAFDPELEHRQYGEKDRRAWVRCRSSASRRPTGGKKPIVPPDNTITLRASLPTESGRFHLWGRVRNL